MKIGLTVRVNRQFGKAKKEITAIGREVVREYADDFAIAAQHAIKENNFYVPFGSTRTASREKVQAGNRDIVDSGALLNSLEITEQGNRTTIAWTAPHAKAVRFGYATFNAEGVPQNRFMPGRDWIAVAQKEVPLPKKRGGKSLRGVIVADSGAQIIPG